MSRNSIQIAIIGLFLIAVAALPAAAATLWVGPDETYTTIQAAVDAADPGDEIIIRNGTYTDPVTVYKQLEIRSQSWIDHGLNSGVIINVRDLDSVHAISVTAGGTTVEGLSIMGATGWVMPENEYANGILVLEAEDCVIANNRCGWLGCEEGNSVAIRIEGCLRTHIHGNEIDGIIHGLWYEDSSHGLIEMNEIHNNYNASSSGGIYMIGSYDAPVPEQSCANNLISNNQFHGNAAGIYLLTYAQHNTFVGNEIGSNYVGIRCQDSSNHNVFSNNNISGNSSRGLWSNGAHDNVVVDNNFADNNRSIWFGYQSPSDTGADYNTVARNRIINNSWAGIEISPKSDGNRMFLNFFAGNGANVRSWGTSWNTATPVSYYYNGNWGSPLGNYYDTYTGTDIDGDGIGDTDLPFIDGDAESGPEEYYPLIDPPQGYTLQAWYLQGDDPKTMYLDDETRLVGEVDIAGHASVIWISDEPAAEALAFGVGSWNGLVRFVSLASYLEVTVEIGTSTDGTDFTASGASATIGGDWNEAFTTSAAAISVAAGEYLAARVSNLSDWEFTIGTGGASTYVSGPGIGDPYWPHASAAFVPPMETSPVYLSQNHPNPFNPATVIAFELRQAATVDLRVYDVAGRLVRTLIDGRDYAAGTHDVTWRGRDDADRAVAAGVYVYRMKTGGAVQSKRMVLVR